ncbi:MAG: FG-GAP-like repeat-containing protein [Methanobacteriota archaeon]
MKKHIHINLLCIAGFIIFILMTPTCTSGNAQTTGNQQIFSCTATQVLDLVVTNSDDDTISFIPGSSTGEFGTPHMYLCGQNPVAIVSGDFNKDGYLDCAVTNWQTAQVSVLLGDGLGKFSPPQQHSVISYPYDITVGDFNEDDNLDLAVTNSDPDDHHSSVSVLFGDGNGGFSEKHDFLVGYGPTGIVTADFNDDSNQDIAVANAFEGSIGILYGDGTGEFADCLYYPLDFGILDLGVGDFNHDFYPDLVTANQVDDMLVMLLGDGHGWFTSPIFFPVDGGGEPWQITLNDFDNDGNSDVAVTNELGNTVTVFLGDGTGGFKGNNNYPVGSLPIGIASADFNSDTFPDIAVANAGDDLVIVLFNDGTGSFSNSLDISVGNAPFGLVAGKFRTDTTPPTLSIQKPENALYITNKKILPLNRPFIIGSIDLEVDTSDGETEIDHVDFYIDSTLRYTDTQAPYSWTWSQRSFFFYKIQIVSYDIAGNSVSREKIVFKFL